MTILSFLISVAFAQSDRYVRLQVIADTFQDVSMEAEARPWMRLDQTKYRVEAELFYMPGRTDFPAFLRTQFNVRRENHHWVNIAEQTRQIVFEKSGGAWVGTAQKVNFDLDRMALARIAESLLFRSGAEVTLSEAQFTQPAEEGPVSFRLTHVDLREADDRRSIQFDRRFEGRGLLWQTVGPDAKTLRNLTELSLKCAVVLD